MKVFVIMHKEMDKYYIVNNLYANMLVGAFNKNSTIEFRDDIGENISNKNNSFCELTGLYWLWKHSNESVIGMMHYRRFLTKNIFSKKNKYLLNQKDIESVLEKYDIILPKRTYFKTKVISEKSTAPNLNDMAYIRKIITQKYPNYISSFDNVLNKKSTYLYNILICKKETFDSYLSFLFDVLFEAERIIPIESYSQDDYRARLFGFISERLLTVWVDANKLRRKEFPILNTSNSITRNVLDYFRNFLRKILF